MKVRCDEDSIIPSPGRGIDDSPMHRHARLESLINSGQRLLLMLLLCSQGDVFAGPRSPVLTINEEASEAQVVSTPVKDGINVLSGAGGNIGVLAGTDGKFVIDSGIALSKEKIASELSALDDGKIRYLVNTHYHWDHTDGNVWMHDRGAVIVATSAAAKRLGQITRVDDWSYTFQPLPVRGLPTVLIGARKSYQFAGQTVLLVPVPPAHTDGDLYVHIQPADVMFLGDLFWNGAYPFIDNQNGGSIDGLISALDLILGEASERTVIVPGHGPPGTKAELEEYRNMLVSIRDNIASLKGQGKSVVDVVAAAPTARYDAKFGNFVVGPEFFARIVHDGLK